MHLEVLQVWSMKTARDYSIIKNVWNNRMKLRLVECHKILKGCAQALVHVAPLLTTTVLCWFFSLHLNFPPKMMQTPMVT
jgi:hypothetical protein